MNYWTMGSDWFQISRNLLGIEEDAGLVDANGGRASVAADGEEHRVVLVFEDLAVGSDSRHLEHPSIGCEAHSFIRVV